MSKKIKKEEEINYYTLKNIMKNKAEYYMIYGERSNGKTTSVLEYCLDKHIESGYVKQLGLIRRWEEDFKGKNGQQMYESIINLGWVKEKTKGKYNSVRYYAQRWYLCNFDENGKLLDSAEKPFTLGFALTMEEHYKSTSYPDISYILFDEFITRGYYLPDEFIKFQNLLSTLIRLKDDVIIFMCGNSINRFCPYFNEMGLTGIKNQKRGTIDIYTYGESGLTVAVEYSDFPSKKKPSNKYFAFNNPKLQMITNGGWEIDIYPHLPIKYQPKDVIYHFYILFDRELLQGNIINVEDKTFIYIHRKTTKIRDDNVQLVYQQQTDVRSNYRVNLFKPYEKVDKFITGMFNHHKVFYQDNEVGEIVNNYINWCAVNG